MDQTPQDILQSLDPSLIMENRGHLFPYGYPQRQYPNPLPHSINSLHPPSSFTDVPQVPQSSSSITPAPHQFFDSSRHLLEHQINLSHGASSVPNIRPFPDQYTNQMITDERNINARSVIINHRIPIDASHSRNPQELNELNTQSASARIYNPVRHSSDDYKYSHSDDKFDRISTNTALKNNENFNDIRHPKSTKIAGLSLGIDTNHQEPSELTSQSVSGRIYNPVRDSSDYYKYFHSDYKFDRIPSNSLPKNNENFTEINNLKTAKFAGLSRGIDINSPTTGESHHQSLQSSRDSDMVHDQGSPKPNLACEYQSICSKSQEFPVNVVESRLPELDDREHYGESGDNSRKIVSSIKDLSTSKKDEFLSNNQSVVAKICESSSESVPTNSTLHLKLEDRENLSYSNTARPNTSLEFSLSHFLDHHPKAKVKSRQSKKAKDSSRTTKNDDDLISKQMKETKKKKNDQGVSTKDSKGSDTDGQGVSTNDSQSYGKDEVHDVNEVVYRFLNSSSIVKPVERFQCDECDASYSTKGNLKMHKKTHGGIQLICDFCEKGFFHRHQLERHRRQHTGEKPFTCSECEASFVAKETLTNHIRIKHKGERFKCDLCDATFSRKDHLTCHNKIHTGEKPYKCEQCSKAFTYRSTFISHQFEHTDTEFKCEECGKCFKDPLALQRHSKKHSKKSDCGFCEKKFEKSDLKIHRRIHSGEKPFVCETCNASFVKRSYLTIHIRNHTGERPFKCDQCDSAFMCRAGLRAHLRTHMEIRPYKCELCDARFAQKANLNSHVKRTHIKGEKPYKCDECDATFTQKSEIKPHKERKHSGNKPFACDECNSSFVKQGYLIAHKLQDHATGKDLESGSSHDASASDGNASDGNLKCIECDISLPNQFAFILHMRKHDGKNKFVCSDCGASFLIFSRLEAHRRQHTGERPFKCDKCDAAFTVKGKLTTHYRKHSNERPFKCEECEASFKQKRNLLIHCRKHADSKAKGKPRKSQKQSSPKWILDVNSEEPQVTNDVDPLAIKEEPQETVTMDYMEYGHLVPEVEIKTETEEREDPDKSIDSNNS